MFCEGVGSRALGHLKIGFGGVGFFMSVIHTDYGIRV